MCRSPSTGGTGQTQPWGPSPLQVGGGNHRPKSRDRDRRPRRGRHGMAADPAPVPAGASPSYGEMARQHPARWSAGQSERTSGNPDDLTGGLPAPRAARSGIQGSLVRPSAWLIYDGLFSGTVFDPDILRDLRLSVGGLGLCALQRGGWFLRRRSIGCAGKRGPKPSASDEGYNNLNGPSGWGELNLKNPSRTGGTFNFHCAASLSPLCWPPPGHAVQIGPYFQFRFLFRWFPAEDRGFSQPPSLLLLVSYYLFLLLGGDGERPKIWPGQ